MGRTHYFLIDEVGWLERDRRDDMPAHKTYIDSFYLDKYEVTNEEYARRPYNELMKDISATYASVKKDLDANAAPAVAADATKLQSLFKDTEDFWAQFKTKDALDAAKGAQDAAGAIVAAAKANSMQKAQVSYTGRKIL